MLRKDHLRKAIQACGVLVNQTEHRELNYMRLLKLLYIAQRESFRDRGLPIIDDQPVAMQRGPLFSDLYNLIKGEHISSSEWQQFFRKRDYHIQMVLEPGREKLSSYEIEKLNEVWEEHRQHDEWDLVNITHEFPEWEKNRPERNTSHLIPIRDILNAVDRSGDADCIVEEMAIQSRLDRAFAQRAAGRSVDCQDAP